MSRIKVWLGLNDGKLHFYADEDYYAGVPRADVFRTKRDAQRCYEDVREATLEFRRSRRKKAGKP